MEVTPRVSPSLSTPERLMAVSFFRKECGRQNLELSDQRACIPEPAFNKKWPLMVGRAFDRGKGRRGDRHGPRARITAWDFRRENSSRLRGRGKTSAKKGRTIRCFSKGWKLSQSSASGCGIYSVKSTPRNPSAELNLPFSPDRFASDTTCKKPTRWPASKSSICRHPRGRFIGRAKLPSCWPQRREHLPLQLTSWRRKMIRFSPLKTSGSTPFL